MLDPIAAEQGRPQPTVAPLKDVGRRFAFVLNQCPANEQVRLTLAVTKRLETDAPIAQAALAARLDQHTPMH